MALNISMPALDDDSRPFWEGVKEHTLKIQQCDDCHQAIFYPRFVCPHCFSENVSWIEASGKGTIYSYTVVHRTLPTFKDEVPFVVGIIELEEGARMLSRVVGPRDKVSIDKPVSVVFEDVNDEVTLPYFKLEE